ncbi:putative short-chain dehydrogenase [Phaeomoniella chlamydospora]|uniref:Putative short-chain dehydrogenase n=1 Tax=Phaeomoniella chlamydospora TaxID=158046 RepID=A0A0G2G598_PHACM|nr:putative short-chain dehydrogenase [Phaeomoniella chlamydospora]
MGILPSRPTSPTLTEKTLPDQAGKVFIVTGGSSGVGLELANILYGHNAKVYIAARSSEKANEAISTIKSNHPNSKGGIAFLRLDLNDLTGIKSSVEDFLGKETRLDVLWNNAGVMMPPQGSKTAQGYELQLGTNNVATFLFTKLLTPILQKTAKTAPEGSVRVVWVASSAIQLLAPATGVEMDNLDYKRDARPWTKYGASKAGNYFHGVEYAKRYGSDGIVSVSLDPGNLETDLYRYVPTLIRKTILKLVLYPSINGAYTELYGGLSNDITLQQNGCWVKPFGQVVEHPRHSIRQSCQRKEDGGTGIAQQFWEWSEEQVHAYAT